MECPSLCDVTGIALVSINWINVKYDHESQQHKNKTKTRITGPFVYVSCEQVKRLFAEVN